MTQFKEYSLRNLIRTKRVEHSYTTVTKILLSSLGKNVYFLHHVLQKLLTQTKEKPTTNSIELLTKFSSKLFDHEMFTQKPKAVVKLYLNSF